MINNNNLYTKKWVLHKILVNIYRTVESDIISGFTYDDGISAIWAHILNQTPIVWVIIYSNIYFNYF